MKRVTGVPAQPLRRDQGAAVLIALVSTMLLSAIGLGLIVVTNTEATIASNYREASETFYAAEAAVELAVSELAGAMSWTPVLTGAITSAFQDNTLAPVLISGQTLNLAALTASVQAASNAWAKRGADNPKWRLFLYRGLSDIVGSAESRAYVVAWVADDASEADQDPLADSNGLLALRALAVGRPGTQRSIEAILKKEAFGVTVLSWREVW